MSDLWENTTYINLWKNTAVNLLDRRRHNTGPRRPPCRHSHQIQSTPPTLPGLPPCRLTSNPLRPSGSFQTPPSPRLFLEAHGERFAMHNEHSRPITGDVFTPHWIRRRMIRTVMSRNWIRDMTHDQILSLSMTLHVRWQGF